MATPVPGVDDGESPAAVGADYDRDLRRPVVMLMLMLEDHEWFRRARSGVAIAAIAIGIGIVVAMFLLSDEKGAPVPYRYHGVECWKAGDLLSCDRPGRTTDIFVRHRERWLAPNQCRDVSSTISRCEQPYPFELDSSGDYTKLRRLSDE